MKLSHSLRCAQVILITMLVMPVAWAQEPLTLAQALEYGLANSPALLSAQSQEKAAESASAQARALPNPELSLEAENIYGSGSYKAWDGAEITYGLSQLLELPGKRGNRVKIADTEKEKVHYAHDAHILDLKRDITIAYAEVAAAQQDVSIFAEEQILAQKVRDSVTARVVAGKEPPIQKNKAEIECTSSMIALDRARRVLNAKQQALSALMGGYNGVLVIKSDSLPSIQKPDAFAIYKERLSKTPEAKNAEGYIAQARSNLSLEKANAIPDPTLNLGIRDLREDDRRAFVAGVSFPIPVFNANRAGIARAGHELNAAIKQQEGIVLTREAQIVEIYGAFENAYNEATTLKNSVLPGAEEAFRFAREGYEAGKFNYLDVLDAQRTLFNARKQSNQAVLDYHHRRALLERMTAIHDIKDIHHDTIKN